MVNKSECSKKFKKLCDKTIYVTKKEIRSAKEYSKLWNTYSTINDSINNNVKRLNSANLALQRRMQNTDALKKLDQDRADELENVKQEIKAIQEKILATHKNDSQEAEQANSHQQELLRLNVLKTCTKTYINDKVLPHIIRGFSANEETTKIVPFEFDPGRMKVNEIQDALWENCLKTSSYMNEWTHLFIGESGPCGVPMDT